MRGVRIGLTLTALAAVGCATAGAAQPIATAQTVAGTPSRAIASDGRYISWREHRVDDEALNGGVPIRGGDGLVMADIDRDGIFDIVSVHEDSNHLRIAFGTPDPDVWELVTIASGDAVAAIEDVAVGDLDGDGWLDLVAACEEAHLAYFENPGASARTDEWARLIPEVTQGRGSWLRVFVEDVTGDGRADVLAANKGAADIIDPGAPRDDRTTSLFTIAGDPLEQGAWKEQVLFARDVPNTAMPVDIDGDGDFDVLAAARLLQQVFILENRGTGAEGSVAIEPHPVVIEIADPARAHCAALSSAFQSDFADLDRDGRLDLVVGVMERCGDARAPGGLPALGWLRQPERLGEPWTYHRIGDIQPDMVIGIELADFDGDGDLDAVTGGYSGLNILAGGYSDASRDEDSPNVTASSTVGRIAWFANPGDPAGEWQRHDISRRVRGMYDAFVARDMDDDGDLDLVATRGNSGTFDGVFWLEQLRTDEPAASFAPARPEESRPLSLPPADWIERYGRERTLVPPNKQH